MSKWKCEICNSEFDNYQAQGFNGTIYCPLCYFKELYKREKTKNDKVIEYIKNKLSSLNMNKSAIMRIVEPSNGYLLADVNYEIQKWERLLEILGDDESE